MVFWAWFMAIQSAGCGGSAPVPAPAAPAAEQSAAPAKPVGFGPSRAEPVVEVEDDFDLSGVDPGDVFAASDEPIPNFRTAGKGSTDRARDLFAVAAPSSNGSVDDFIADGSTAARIRAGNPARPASQLPQGFAAVGNSTSADGRPMKILCEADGTQMVLIEGGQALIGTDFGPDNCSPRVRVELDSYYIGVREVTVDQFLAVRRKLSLDGTTVEEPSNAEAAATTPVLGVTWGGARAYAKFVGCGLPTEAQWERAARGVEGLSMPWGDSRPLWRTPRQVGQIDPVGTHPDDQTAEGVLDMAGNAREWTLDFYADNTFQEASLLEAERRRNFAGPRRASVSGQRVVKGGEKDWATWNRAGVLMTDQDARVGFRCVLNLPAAAD